MQPSEIRDAKKETKKLTNVADSAKAKDSTNETATEQNDTTEMSSKVEEKSSNEIESSSSVEKKSTKEVNTERSVESDTSELPVESDTKKPVEEEPTTELSSVPPNKKDDVPSNTKDVPSNKEGVPTDKEDVEVKDETSKPTERKTLSERAKKLKELKTGDRITMHWPMENANFVGTLVQEQSPGRWLIRYDDGDLLLHALHNDNWQFHHMPNKTENSAPPESPTRKPLKSPTPRVQSSPRVPRVKNPRAPSSEPLPIPRSAYEPPSYLREAWGQSYERSKYEALAELRILTGLIQHAPTKTSISKIESITQRMKAINTMLSNAFRQQEQARPSVKRKFQHRGDIQNMDTQSQMATKTSKQIINEPMPQRMDPILKHPMSQHQPRRGRTPMPRMNGLMPMPHNMMKAAFTHGPPSMRQINQQMPRGISGNGTMPPGGGMVMTRGMLGNMSKGISQGIPQGAIPQGMNGPMPQRVSSIPQGMNTGMQHGMAAGMQGGMPQNMPQGMPQGMPPGMQGVQNQGMPQGRMQPPQGMYRGGGGHMII